MKTLTFVHVLANPGNSWLDSRLTLYRRDGEFIPAAVEKGVAELASVAQLGAFIGYLVTVALGGDWHLSRAIIEPAGQVLTNPSPIGEPPPAEPIFRARFAIIAERMKGDVPAPNDTTPEIPGKPLDIDSENLPTEARDGLIAAWSECVDLIQAD